MSVSRAKVTSGKASLIGGIVVGVACFVLWVAVTHELGVDTMPWLVAGFFVSAGVGAWIRVADL